MTRIFYIAIGDELLRGRIVNTNARTLALQLRSAGFDLEKIITIGDDPEAIRHTVTTALEEADVLILTGGLGPTKDDMTKHTLADIFGHTLILHQPTLDYLEERYAKHKRVLNDATRAQALQPDGATVLENTKGTAPGMLFQQGDKRVFSLAGVPFEMSHLVDTHVIPHLAELRGEGQYFYQKVLRTRGLSESEAAMRLAYLYDDMPSHVKLAYLPRIDGLWLELQSTGPLAQEGAARTVLDKMYTQLKSTVADALFAEGAADVAALLGDALRTQQLSVGTAESLTAGLVAARICDVSGASTYMKGSIVAYETAQKSSLLDVDADLIDKEGVVSEAVVREMALGAQKRLGCDVSIATTGWAEYDPATKREAQAWLGVATPHGCVCKRVALYGDRNTARGRAAESAIILALEVLQAQR